MEDMRSHCEVYGNTTILNAKDCQLPKYKTRLWQRYEFYPNNTAIKEILKFIPFLQIIVCPPITLPFQRVSYNPVPHYSEF